MNIGLRDMLYITALAVAVAGSHFTVNAKVMVLEERVSGHTDLFERIERSLGRIEEKIDSKADR